MAAEKSKKVEEKIIIDGENALLGRLSSYVAKKALQGNKVIILNAEKVVVSGSKKGIIDNYLVKRARKNVKFPSQADKILKRTIRGMLPYKKARGKEALKRIRCYVGVPKEFMEEKKIKAGRKKKNTVKLSLISEMLKNKK